MRSKFARDDFYKTDALAPNEASKMGLHRFRCEERIPNDDTRNKKGQWDHPFSRLLSVSDQQERAYGDQ
jgi:hypothetical protein